MAVVSHLLECHFVQGPNNVVINACTFLQPAGRVRLRQLSQRNGSMRGHGGLLCDPGDPTERYRRSDQEELPAAIVSPASRPKST